MHRRFARFAADVVTCGAVAGILACADASAPTHPPPPTDIQVLTLDTFDGSGQAVHPDPAITPLSWSETSNQLMVTPYPNGDASKENPSLFTTHSEREWQVPSGVMNPIARPMTGYLSDPDEVYNPDTGELWLYYRAVTNQNEILLLRGAAPTRWSSPTLVVSGPNHTIVSPSVVRRATGDWLMWAVNSGPTGCASATTVVELRSSPDGVTWSAPVATDLAERDPYPWHIDVEWIPSRNEYWAIYNVKVAGSCTTAALHYATSADGIHWTPGSGPVLTRGVIPAFQDIVYRGAVEFDAQSNAVTLWYSGARYQNGRYDWRIATERMTLEEFLARGSGAANITPSVTDAPPLTDSDAP
jgi:hypothetical protein